MTTEEIIKLVLETSGQQGLSELTTKAKEAAEALDEVGDAAEHVEKKTLDLQGLASQGKGLFSAFQGGDIDGIVHGITGMVALVPGLNSFAPIITKIGDAAIMAWPHLKKIYEVMGPKEDVKKAAEQLQDYGERVNEFGETVKNLTSHEAALNAEKAKSNKLDEEAVKWGEKLAGLRPLGEAEAEEKAAAERSENLQAEFGGKQEEIIEAVAQAMRVAEIAKSQAATAGGRPPDLSALGGSGAEAAEYDKALDRLHRLEKGIPEDVQGQARGTVSKAIIGGEEKALRDILKYLTPDRPGAKFRAGFEAQLPEELAMERDEEALFNKGLAERSAAVRRRNENKARRDADNKKIEEENERGSEYQRLGEAEQTKAANDARDRAGREAEKLRKAGGAEDPHRQALNRRELIEGAQAVQMQKAIEGVNISLGRAAEIFRTLLDSQAKLDAKNKELEQIQRGAKGVNQQINRSAQTNGLN